VLRPVLAQCDPHDHGDREPHHANKPPISGEQASVKSSTAVAIPGCVMRVRMLRLLSGERSAHADRSLPDSQAVRMPAAPLALRRVASHESSCFRCFFLSARSLSSVVSPACDSAPHITVISPAAHIDIVSPRYRAKEQDLQQGAPLDFSPREESAAEKMSVRLPGQQYSRKVVFQIWIQ
jgi:hypothetical protein